MGFWAGILIGIFVGEIMGIFTFAFLKMGYVDDLEHQLMQAKSIKHENK